MKMCYVIITDATKTPRIVHFLKTKRSLTPSVTTMPKPKRVVTTLSAGLNTKGAFHRLNYAQLEGNVGFRFIDTPQGFRVSALTGPCFGIRVADDLGEVPAIMEARPTIFGWQGGISMKYKFLALKVGYEHPLSGYWVSDIFERIGEPIIGYRLMTTSKPQSLFIRLGITF